MITLFQNDVVTLTFTITKDNQTVDLTGATVYFHVKQADGTLVKTITATITNAVEGEVEVNIDTEVTNSPAVYIYEIEIDTSSGDKYTAVRDVLQIKPAVKA